MRLAVLIVVVYQEHHLGQLVNMILQVNVTVSMTLVVAPAIPLIQATLYLKWTTFRFNHLQI